ncbi:hypothetical protein [Runella rosea]|nr:hypothetical protein [Runella rosea]
MKDLLPKSIFELIDSESFRKRTAMYIGKKSISALRIFMDGYQTCELFNGIKTKETKPPFWIFFYWICKYYNHSGSYYSWDGIILQNCENDEVKAIETFFERFDEFRQFQPKRLIASQISDKAINFFYSNEGKRRLIKNGEEKRIGPADKVFIIEYDNNLGCSSHHRKDNKGINFDYFESVNKAIEDAEKEYGKSLNWKEVPQDKIEMIYEKII